MEETKTVGGGFAGAKNQVESLNFGFDLQKQPTRPRTTADPLTSRQSNSQQWRMIHEIQSQSEFALKKKERKREKSVGSPLTGADGIEMFGKDHQYQLFLILIQLRSSLCHQQCAHISLLKFAARCCRRQCMLVDCFDFLRRYLLNEHRYASSR